MSCPLLPWRRSSRESGRGAGHPYLAYSHSPHQGKLCQRTFEGEERMAQTEERKGNKLKLNGQAKPKPQRSKQELQNHDIKLISG